MNAVLKNPDRVLEIFGKIHSLWKQLNEHFGEHPNEHLSEHYWQYISITYGCATEHISEHPSEHLTERYLTNFTTSSRTYLLRPAIPNPRDLSISIKYHL